MAVSSLADLPGFVIEDISSSTPEGLQAILQREYEWALAQQFTTPTTHVTRAIPTDPLLNDQWHLINVGQQVGSPDYQTIFAIPGEDINVAPVWNDGITGEGVVVAVLDSGVETAHPDLDDNIHPTLQFDAITGDDNPNPVLFPFDPQNPFLYDPSNAHGTAVAGLIAAEANNGLGGTGVAPGATIVPIRLIDAGQTALSTVAAFRFADDVVDITNNSWGPADIRAPAGPTGAELLAIRDSVFFGRDGKGTIHVWAAGNGAQFNDVSTFDGYVNSRYTIGVTGVDHDGFYNNIDGTVTNYPEIGASVLVASPTGSVFQTIVDDTGIGSGLVTTDTTGNTGFNIDGTGVLGNTFDRDFLEDERFTSRFNGTSGSSPIAAGVVALMLEVNPDLSWRDVQEILVRSARQNAPLGEPADGLDKALGISRPNTWIVNQRTLFHDPDPYVPTIDPLLQVLSPTLNPVITNGPNSVGRLQNNIHYGPRPPVVTTGAGYTVSQGIGSDADAIGYAHGVIDAELAVALSQQWHTKSQQLPDELTFTTAVNSIIPSQIAAGESVAIGDDQFMVPGGFLGEPGFGGYWAEYFDDEPFDPDFDIDLNRSLPLDLVVPDDNAMTVETVELRMNIANNAASFFDHVRVTLISPDGTVSEMNHEFIDPTFGGHIIQPIDGISIIGEPGTTVPGTFSFTFATNRSWGERSDSSIVFDPTTNEPFINTSGFNLLNPGLGGNFGDPLRQGWQLHFENYSGDTIDIDSFEIAWHGSPINPNTQRVKGFVGLDENQDDLFNYSRIIQTEFDFFGDPDTVRLGEVLSVVDPDQEAMAENITVTARRVSDGAIVDQFVTGADGNYYFDLVPDDYIISIEDPMGRTALDDSLTPTGFLQKYQSEWLLTEDYFQVWDYDANLNVPIDPATGAPVPWLDGNLLPVEYGAQNVNFLLDPGAPALNQVVFSGVVFADTAGDGAFNAKDVQLPNVKVFADVNRNNQFDSGEPVATTDGTGAYNLVVPTSFTTIMNVGVIPPHDWTVSNPIGGLDSFFVSPGDALANVDFAVVPTASSGNGASTGGIILGNVFDDDNGDRTQQANELGVSGLTVYIDNNFSGDLDAGDTTTVSNEFGAYAFTGLAPGSYNVAIDIESPFVQTMPAFGAPFSVVLAGGGTAYPVNFGVQNTAILDYGDLPPIYGITLLAEDGARHPRGIFFLGERIDTELDGQPNSDATGDDLIGDDEDGVVVTPLTANSVGSLVATASRHGGYFKGWMDFNNDGDFDDVGERLVFSDPADPSAPPRDNWLLDAGANALEFDIPDITGGVVYARFRYGEFEIDSVTGAGQIGEVEDYEIDVNTPIIVDAGDPGDFNEDGRVTGWDFLAWQAGHGTQANAARIDGDSDGDGDVDGVDLGEWQAAFNAGAAAATVPATGDYNLNGVVNGRDFLAWQQGVGSSDPAIGDGDGNQDDAVDGDDLDVWAATFSQGAEPVDAGAGGVSRQVFASLNVSNVSAASAGAAVRIAPAGLQTPLQPLQIDSADRLAAADAAFDDASGELPPTASVAALGLLRRDEQLDDDLFTVERQRAFAEQHEQADDHDEVFGRLPKAFYWR